MKKKLLLFFFIAIAAMNYVSAQSIPGSIDIPNPLSVTTIAGDLSIKIDARNILKTGVGSLYIDYSFVSRSGGTVPALFASPPAKTPINQLGLLTLLYTPSSLTTDQLNFLNGLFNIQVTLFVQNNGLYQSLGSYSSNDMRTGETITLQPSFFTSLSQYIPASQSIFKIDNGTPLILSTIVGTDTLCLKYDSQFSSYFSVYHLGLQKYASSNNGKVNTDFLIYFDGFSGNSYSDVTVSGSKIPMSDLGNFPIELHFADANDPNSPGPNFVYLTTEVNGNVLPVNVMTDKVIYGTKLFLDAGTGRYGDQTTRTYFMITAPGVDWTVDNSAAVANPIPKANVSTTIATTQISNCGLSSVNRTFGVTNTVVTSSTQATTEGWSLTNTNEVSLSATLKVTEKAGFFNVAEVEVEESATLGYKNTNAYTTNHSTTVTKNYSQSQQTSVSTAITTFPQQKQLVSVVSTVADSTTVDYALALELTAYNNLTSQALSGAAMQNLLRASGFTGYFVNIFANRVEFNLKQTFKIAQQYSSAINVVTNGVCPTAPGSTCDSSVPVDATSSASTAQNFLIINADWLSLFQPQGGSVKGAPLATVKDAYQWNRDLAISQGNGVSLIYTGTFNVTSTSVPIAVGTYDKYRIAYNYGTPNVKYVGIASNYVLDQTPLSLFNETDTGNIAEFIISPANTLGASRFLYTGDLTASMGLQYDITAGAGVPIILGQFSGLASDDQGDLFYILKDCPQDNPNALAYTLDADVAITSATLRGSVNPEGTGIYTVAFEYGLSSDPATFTNTINAGSASGSNFSAIAKSVTGLALGTDYYYRIKIWQGGTTAASTIYGNVVKFTTTSPYTVTTKGANISNRGATLHGLVRGTQNGYATLFFEYGPTNSYDKTLNGTPDSYYLIGGAEDQPVTATLSGLSANTVYHYRLKGMVAGVTYYGRDSTFLTLPDPNFITLPAVVLSNRTATLNGKGRGVALYSDMYFEYGTDTHYGDSTDIMPTSLTSDYQSVATSIQNLASNTLYHYRIKSNVQGTIFVGADMTFTTYKDPEIQNSPYVFSDHFMGFITSTLTFAVIPHKNIITGGSVYIGTDISYDSSYSVFGPISLDQDTAVLGYNAYYLTPNTTYHYRAAFTIDTGVPSAAPDVIYGPDGTFTTPAGPAPTLTALPLPGVTNNLVPVVSGVSTQVTVAGTINLNGSGSQAPKFYYCLESAAANGVFASLAANGTYQTSPYSLDANSFDIYGIVNTSPYYASGSTDIALTGIITNMAPGTYRYYVVTVAGGYSPNGILYFSPNYTTFTVGAVPDAPTGLIVTTDNSAFNIFWTAPASDGGSAITQYVISMSSDGVNWDNYYTGNTLTSIITGVVPIGYVMYYKIAAINAFGTGAFTAVVGPTVIGAVPDAPTGLTVTQGNNVFNLSWTAPGNNGGSQITQYVIDYSYDGVTYYPYNTGNSLTSFTTGTQPTGTIQYYKVAAINAFGTGAFTAVVGPTVIGGWQATSHPVISTSPNPVTSVSYGRLNISDAPTGTTYTITDQQGRQLLTGILDDANPQIDLSSLQPSVYVLSLFSSGGVITTRRIIKE